MKFIEKVNVEVLKEIVKKVNSVPTSDGKSTLGKSNDNYQKSCKYALKHYLSILNEKGEANVSYEQNKNLKTRFCCENGIGLQLIPRKVRSWIAGDIFTDIDVKGCHHAILKNLFIRMGVAVPETLKLYLEDKKEFEKVYGLNKNDMIKMINKEELNKGKKFQELKEFHTLIYKDLLFDLKEKEKKFIKNVENYLTKQNKDYNRAGKTISHFLQHEENKILQVMISYIKDSHKDIKIGVLCYDGLMLYNNDAINDELLRDIEKAVKRYTDYDIQLVFKDFDYSWDYKNAPEDEFDEEIIDEDEIDKKIKLNDKQITDAYYEFSKEIGSKIIYVKNELWICDINCIWKKGNEANFRFILDDTDFNNYLIKTHGNKINYDNANSWEKLYKYFKTDIRFRSTIVFNDKPDLLAFDNKKCVILNKLNKAEPYVIRDLLPNDYTTMSTGFSLNKELIEQDYQLFCKSLIANQFQDPETAETYLSILGLSLYGELLVKKFFINKGFGDNGRSFFSNLIHEVFGDYHGVFNSDFFLSKQFNDGNIRSPESIENKDKRFITIQEPTSSNNYKKTTWANEKIKTFSGNDLIQVRKLKSNDITNYRNKATIINMLNTMIHFETVDGAMIDRIVVIPQDTQFVDEISLPHHKLKIQDQSFFKTDKFKNCTMFLLLDYWGKFVNNNLILVLSKQIKDYTFEMVSDKLDKFLVDFYVKTNNRKDFITLDDMYNLYLQEVAQGQFVITKDNFKDKVISKKYVINKIDRGTGANRINKLAVLFFKRNECVKIDNNGEEFEFDELNKYWKHASGKSGIK